MIEIFSMTIKQAFPFAIMLMLLFGMMLRSSRLLGIFASSIRKRDMHKAPTPNIGGIGIFSVYFIFSIFYLELPLKETIFVIYFFCIGVIDDFSELSGIKKLFAFFVPIIIYIGYLNFNSSLLIPWAGDVTWCYIPHYVFAAGLLFSAINGNNTIDGIDLLCASLASITIGGLGVIAYKYNLELEFKTCTITLILLIPFIAYNSPPARLFLGDSGSLFLGALIGVVCMSIWIKTKEDSPFYLILVLGVPFIDMITVTINRVRLGLKPWNADQNHIHHLLSKRFNDWISLCCIIFVHTILVLTSVISAIKFQTSKNAFYAIYFIFFLVFVLKHYQLIQITNNRTK